MITRLICGLTLALAIIGGLGTIQKATAAPTAERTVVSKPTLCDTYAASFTVQTTQRYSIFSAKVLTVHGTCFSQGATVNIWDYDARASLTGGWLAVPTDSSGQFTYTVPNAVCHHLLQVRVLDSAHNSLARGNGKTYGPCQLPPPVLAS